MKKIFTKYNKKNGYIYLEMLCSLFINISILGSIIILTKIQFNDLFFAKKFFHKIYTTSKIDSILRKIAKDIDSHPFFILPIIHNGNISHQDGTITTLSTRKDNLKNDNLSNAISYMDIDFENILKTKDYKGGIFYLCPFFNKTATLTNIRSFLAVSSDNFYETSLTLTKNGSCYVAKINSLASVLTQTAPKNIKFIFFIPIESTYTIYLAENKTLRFVTHKNNKILENQPIAQNIFKIKFFFRHISNDFLKLSSEVFVNEKDKKSFYIEEENLLKRQNVFNFISYINEYKNDY